MILADTSVWVDHLRSTNLVLAEHLRRDEVWMHPFVAGELALGNLPKRAETLEALDNMRQAELASEREVRGFLDGRKLWGLGIGYIDLHLLASARLVHARLWTRDKRLESAALKVGLEPYRAH